MDKSLLQHKQGVYLTLRAGHCFRLALSITFFALGSAIPVLAQGGLAPTTRPQGSGVYRQQLYATTPPTATLVFNNQNALYYYGRKEVTKASTKAVQLEEKRYTLDIQDSEGQCVYTDRERAVQLSRMYELSIRTNVIIEEPVPSFNWAIVAETKTLGSYRVQKATTSFRGRRYEAWFAPDLPIALGPWKFGGLPGLILEVYDTDKKFVYEASSIDLPAQILTPILPPVQGRKLQGWEDYTTLVKAGQARLIKYMQAKPGVKVKIDTSGSMEVIE